MRSADFMRRAVEVARRGMEQGQGGPFGAVVVRGGAVVAEGCNRVTSTNDPTAHAEVVAIREACAALGRFDLRGCEVYASCEPCPMCLSALYWARVDRVYYAVDRVAAARIGFDDEQIYRELALPPERRTLPLVRAEDPQAQKVFDDWARKGDRIRY